MISGGNVTLYVSDMQRAVTFYTETLGLELRLRVGDDWAEIHAGEGLILGLHPANGPHAPTPGTPGATRLGLNVTEPLETVMGELQQRGVEFQGPVVEDAHVRLAFLTDPDGNPLYLAQVLHVGASGGPE